MIDLFLHIIVNEHAGSGNGKKVAQSVFRYLTEQNIPYKSYISKYQTHTMVLTQQLIDNNILYPWSEDLRQTPFPLLVVLGGDGTLHEAVNALEKQHQKAIPIGYIPCGSGNDFARSMGIPTTPEKALEHILFLKSPRNLTILYYEELVQEESGYFTNNIGIGLDAAIVATANASRTKTMLNKYHAGSLSYAFAILKVLFKQKGFPVLIKANGKEWNFKNAFLCTTTNHPYFGGGFAIAPDATPTKNEMDLIIVERISMFKILYLVLLLLQKKHMKSKYMHHIQSKYIQIISPTAQFGQSDGEDMGQRSFDITFSTTHHLFWL